MIHAVSVTGAKDEGDAVTVAAKRGQRESNARAAAVTGKHTITFPATILTEQVEDVFESILQDCEARDRIGTGCISRNDLLAVLLLLETKPTLKYNDGTLRAVLADEERVSSWMNQATVAREYVSYSEFTKCLKAAWAQEASEPVVVPRPTKGPFETTLKHESSIETTQVEDPGSEDAPLSAPTLNAWMNPYPMERQGRPVQTVVDVNSYEELDSMPEILASGSRSGSKYNRPRITLDAYNRKLAQIRKSAQKELESGVTPKVNVLSQSISDYSKLVPRQVPVFGIQRSSICIPERGRPAYRPEFGNRPSLYLQRRRLCASLISFL